MKNIGNIFGLLMLFFAFQSSFSQTYIEDKTYGNKGAQGEIMSPEVLLNLGISLAPNPQNAVIQRNTVFIKQIGDLNIANINSSTNASEINLSQNGNFNEARLDYIANTAVADLIQNGDNNSIEDYVNSPFDDISLNLIQEGNNLKFERDGVNELTKSLKFRQNEASPTLIVRSFY